MNITEVVAALIWDGDKFMICQRPAHKARALLWEFVGGKVEPGETKEQALIRECQEELAVTLSVGDVFMDVIHEYPDITVHLTLFNATIAEGIPQKLEHKDIKWITPVEIPKYKFCPADKEILKKLTRMTIMINKIELVAKNDVLIEVVSNDFKKVIRFSDIQPYWSYATEEDFEGGFAKIIGDKILFSLSTASMQGGIVAIWNANSQKIEHISEGAYCVTANIYNGKVYRLLCVSNFVTKEHFELWETPIGTMDANEEGKQINLDFENVSNKFDGSYPSIGLEVSDNSYVINLNGEHYSYTKI